MVICWSCEREGGGGRFCAACGALLPPDDGADLFVVLGLPRTYAVDLGAAEAAYKQLSRQLHPDRFATADPRARRASLAHTVRLNQAWRTLKDPVRRAEYLLELAGVDVASDDSPADSDGDRKTRKISVPPAFLLEILELSDDLQSAQRAGDAVKVAFLTGEIRGRAAQTLTALASALEVGSASQPDAARLDQAARALIELRYYQRFLDSEVARYERAAEKDRDG
jgi:molecular chaperone HscB